MERDLAEEIIRHNKALHDSPRYAANYDQACGIMAHPWERTVFRRDVQEICSRLGSVEGRAVLDVGCGTGSLAMLFLERGFRTVGVDIAEAMLARLRWKAQEAGLAHLLETVCCEANAYLADCPRRFDVIAFSATLHHLPDYVATLRLAADRTKVGGIIYIIHEPSARERVRPLAKALERLDRSLAESRDFLRRQWRDICRHGPATALLAKIKRRLGQQKAPAPESHTSTPDANIDWSLVDYHAKHGGCDEQAIVAALKGAGFHVDLHLYDSKRHRLLHALARLLRTKRMIKVIAQRAF